MLRIVTLVENTTSSPEYDCKHGLSFYVETPGHRMLFDVGPNELFLENARKKGIDLAAVDTVILSHGHYDHGGGLEAFFSVNQTAKVYIRQTAFEPHFSRVGDPPKYIGLDKGLMDNAQFIFTGDELVIDDELHLFSAVDPDPVPSQSNGALMMEKDGQMMQDDFVHEQNLILSVAGEKILMAGCSHAGIDRIQKKAAAIIGRAPDRVIGGFHLYNPSAQKTEPDEVVDETARALLPTGSLYYTCHCTGPKAFDRLKIHLGDRLSYMATGIELLIGAEGIDTRCGLKCEGCEYVQSCGCGGCIATMGKPFHGDCPVAQCCQNKGFTHCGQCPDLPCDLLTQYSCDPEHGDNPAGARIERCRKWAGK